MSTNSLGKKTIVGTMWALGQTALGRVVNIGGHILLAWLLVPSEFGLISLAYTALAFASVLQRAGLNYVLIQRQGEFTEWRNAGFWMGTAFGLTAATLLAIAAPFIGQAYGEEQLAGLIILLAAVPLLDGVGVLPNAKLQIDLRFKAIAVINLVFSTLHIGIAVCLAWRGMGALAFVGGHVAAIVVRTVVLWWLSPVAFGYRPDLGKWPKLIGDGIKLVFSGLFTNILFQADYVILGLMHSSAAVGLYYFAYRLSTQSIQLLSTSLSNVLFPAFSKMQGETERQYAAFRKSTAVMAYAVTPACFLQAAVVSPGIRMIFEPKWHPAIPILQVLSVGMAFRVMFPISNSMLRARGKFTLLLFLSAISAIVFISLVLSMALLGAGFYVAVGASFAFAVLGPVLLHQAFLSVGGSSRDVASVMFRPVVGSALSLAAAMLVGHLLAAHRALIFVELLVTLLVGCVVYLLFGSCYMRPLQVELFRLGSRMLGMRDAPGD